MNWFLYLFAIAAGALSTITSGQNSTLSKTLGQPITASLFLLATQMVLLVAAAAFRGAGLGWPEPGAFAKLPWWAWFGGIGGALVLLSQFFVAQELGAGVYIGLTVTAGILASLVLDHFGLLGFETKPATMMRLAGGALMIGGVFLVSKG